ncbi:hypothetical protein [Pseudoxanthomonas sacheonensis]|uniref:hypothetical protein n=1 Tax=Pseudoxanthomonas sacheonensis TaxID=443615 RepID=UPI0013CFC4DD|nr:hypothetical protein [Pseudoxanthomonas sacheonensis]KAF1706287.1 hypothetical protein CSC73_16415 [Pseudoxanthomonas sacheonensis]
MASFNYPATAATATRLLTRFGATCTLVRTTTGAYDPATGSNTVTVENLPTTAAVFAYDQKYIDGTLILAGDQLAYCAPAVTPKQGDSFTWNSATFTVIAVKPISPAGIPILFEVQIR